MDTLFVRQPATLRRARGMHAAIDKYWAIFQVSLVNNLAYVVERLLRTIFLSLIIFIFVQLWRVTYAGMGAKLIAGFSLQQMIWYLVLTEAITLSRPSVNTKIDEEVRSGGLAYSLGRPYNFLLYQYTSNLGDYLFSFVINLVIGSALALLFVGPIVFSLSGLAVTVVSVLLAITLDLICAICIGLLAFWMEDTRSAMLVFSRFAMILGGLLMPLDVFPEPLASICRALPFSTLFYTPGRFFVAGVDSDLLLAIGKQVFWVVIVSLLAVFIYTKGVSRVESNGG